VGHTCRRTRGLRLRPNEVAGHVEDRLDLFKALATVILCNVVVVVVLVER
jgi:hypothetical protein